MESINKTAALEILMKDAEKIYTLINSQKKHLCFASCPAFEDVVDTQMYGFSREVAFAVKLDIISEEAGQKILSDLESSLNVMYNDFFDQTKNDSSNKGV
ncbi:Hypothetical protein Tpal_309 [Trichococcus palustris]|jgi:uncharacterized protein YlaN (UPF0358 family)|uniref:DUF1507 family protein n=1 Tax=Trichococcus palustris TaxID=140314 RepID=A0A143Y852_9LACT|nr:DUF1507 family protein [Trichococcus palustris]CZQ82344.1 Hypothetical protein Tpal_309 [Trichococcus palustris]SFK67179.1 Uncharacterized protein YlaN, UPF0358 family [Trichococcus palustris]